MYSVIEALGQRCNFKGRAAASAGWKHDDLVTEVVQPHPQPNPLPPGPPIPRPDPLPNPSPLPVPPQMPGPISCEPMKGLIECSSIHPAIKKMGVDCEAAGRGIAKCTR